jgi:NADH-ubiquinone oxidoreductase chain 5
MSVYCLTVWRIASPFFLIFSASFVLLSKAFFLTLMIVVFCVFRFSSDYLSILEDYNRFLFILFRFVVRIVVLIFHRSLFLLFLGWDGLGVTSYVLVFYYLNWSSLNGAIVTLLTNRLGDVCLFLFFCWSWYSFGLGLSFPLLIFIVGCFTKRAQFPFRRWLPLAIRAPTPVSSLVHSRTLVTAGVYLLFSYFYFLSSSVLLWVLLMVGIITSFLSGLLALVEKDMKKIVALRTLSQLGFLVLTLGLGAPSLTLIHLLTHAFFKSCLFIQIGIFIHLSRSLQDGRSYSRGLQLSYSSSTILSVCLFRLCGILFTRGFVRKDLILQSLGISGFSCLIWLLLSFSIVFTYLYSFRLYTILNSSSTVSNSTRRETLYLRLCSLLVLFFGVLGGWTILIRLESFPILIRFWGKVLPFSCLFVGVILLFVGVLFSLEFSIYKIGGLDLAVSETQITSIRGTTLLEKIVEGSGFIVFQFNSSYFTYITLLFKGFRRVWLFSFLIILLMFYFNGVRSILSFQVRGFEII